MEEEEEEEEDHSRSPDKRRNYMITDPIEKRFTRLLVPVERTKRKLERRREKKEK